MKHLPTHPRPPGQPFELTTPGRFQFLARDNDFNAFTLPIYERLGTGPVFVAVANGQIDLDRLLAAHGDRLWRSAANDRRTRRGRWQTEDRLLVFELEPDCFVWVNSSVSCVRVFARDRVLAEQTAHEIADQFRARTRSERPRARVSFVSITPNHIDARSVEIEAVRRLPADELALLYGPGFPEWDEAMSEFLGAPGCGTTILRGPPGTGKTSYLRHLLLKHARTHRFYYIPANSFDLLTSPRMVDFWTEENLVHRNASKVVLLEDAESLISDRLRGGAGHVSDLLNIADGILGDFLRIKVLCTVNCTVDRLDPAMTRSGRLHTAWEFRRLPRDQADRIAARHNLVLPDQPDYSLAEIFCGPAKLNATAPKRAMGFGAIASQT